MSKRKKRGYGIDTEQVIQEVEQRPCLWSKEHEDYKNYALKEKAWLEIAAIIFNNFDDMSTGEKKEAALRVSSRWKVARDQYVKYRRKSKVDAYVYYEAISFLDRSVKVTTNTTTDDASSDHEREDIYFSNQSDDDDTSENPLSTYVAMPKPMKRSSQNYQKMEYVMSADADEDVSFFQSLLPTVKQLDLKKKFYFKGEVMKLLGRLCTEEGPPVAKKFKSEKTDVEYL